ncbi:MAG TPA: T9SS type A sorting domain-containing protein [Bacteroidia bacterium]|nr:T9SS type A sorting domain-containing protein [Bacteroidia bacterium]
MKTFTFFLTSYLLLLTSSVSAQITFQKTFSGIYNEFGWAVQQTTDGGYIIGGSTSSFGAGGFDVYLIKTDAFGDSLWTKTFGGTNYDEGNSVQQTTDGGYIIAGHTSGLGAGSNDVYLIKTDSNGIVDWTKTFGGTTYDPGFSVQQTSDGGYIIAGLTTSFGGDFDIYLIKTNANGDSLWTKTFGGIYDDQGNSIQQTSDGGYIITGTTNSFGAGGSDVYLVRTDSNGNSLWAKTFGGIYDDQGKSIQQTNDGGYILTGTTASFGGGLEDVYLIKTDSSGNLSWTKTFGGIYFDDGHAVQQTTDAGYIIAGSTGGFGSGTFVYLIKTDSNGDSLWTKTFSGTNDALAYFVQQVSDGGYIITGYTLSFGSNYSDIYLIKTDSLGNSGCNKGNIASIVTTSATQVTSPATIVSSTATIVTTPATITGSGGIVTTLCTTVGIKPVFNLQSSIFNISPNPSRGNFTIIFTNAINKGEVQIFNAYGTKVFSQNIRNTSNTEINLKNRAAGIYFVKVNTQQKQYTQKLILE